MSVSSISVEQEAPKCAFSSSGREDKVTHGLLFAVVSHAEARNIASVAITQCVAFGARGAKELEWYLN